MKKIVYVLSLWMLFSACKEQGIEPTKCRDGGTCTYTWQDESTLQFLLGQPAFVRVANGNNYVFEYRFVGKDNPRIADDEITERIFFEIDPTSDSFSFTDDELIDIKAAFQADCECIGGAIGINRGTISGTKLDADNWQIEIDVQFKWADETTRSTSANFERIP